MCRSSQPRTWGWRQPGLAKVAVAHQHGAEVVVLLAAAVHRGRGDPPLRASAAASTSPAAVMALLQPVAAASWLLISSRGCGIGVGVGRDVPGAVAVAGSAVGGCCSAPSAIWWHDAHHTCVQAYQGPQVEGIREGSEVAVHLQPGAFSSSPLCRAHGSTKVCRDFRLRLSYLCCRGSDPCLKCQALRPARVQEG